MSQPTPRGHAAFDLASLREEQQRSARRYLEFLRVPQLSLGLYRLPAGATDEQQPHGEDEVYVVIAGRARLRVGASDHEVAAGALVYVEAHAPHAFHDITEDLVALVFFAPAEGSETRA